MSRVILIYGESGAGKTTSLRNLDPERTFIVDADRKGLSWRGWKKQYSVEKKNYWQTSNVPSIENIFTRIDKGGDWADKFDTLIVDGLSTIMVDDEMARMKERGYDKYQDLVACVWGLIAKSHLLRDDLTVVFIGHSETEMTESGSVFTRLKTSGQKLRKMVPESKFTTVLWAKVLDGKYVFETQANHSTAKSPMGCFDKVIDNDITFVINELIKYEEE